MNHPQAITASLFPPVPEPVANEDFDRCARLLQARAGIVIGDHKRDMVGRIIAARAHQMGMASLRAYLDHLQYQADAPEWEHFINAFTINHTAFFRERHHFDILSEFLRGRSRPVSIWCCAASTGEEAYTIAMIMSEAGHTAETGASVWATDIDTAAIEKARLGVYTLDRVKPVAEAHLKRYFQRGTGPRAGLVRVRPNLTGMVEFGALNLLDTAWPARRQFDAIFCRNIMIYFDKPTQTRILDRFAPVLKSDGLLFAGHSENFTYLTKAFRLRGQTVYVKAN